MPAERTIIATGVYRDEKGGFWVRPWVEGRRTWRKLDAKTQKYALEEARSKFTDHSRAKSGHARSPFSAADTTLRAMAQTYLNAGAPNKRLEIRPSSFVASEGLRLQELCQFFGNMELRSIRMPLLPRYAEWRRARIAKKNCTGKRTIDMELTTLSNVLHYAVAIEHLEYNPIANGRPRYQTASDISHSRERAVASGDEVHRLADRLFASPKSEAMGWLVIFSALTGCRNIELRSFRVDGRDPNTPGWINGNYLFLARAKRGTHPFIEIKGPLADAIDCFQHWHRGRFPAGTRHFSPWWFPGQTARNQIQKDSFRHAVYRACEELGLSRCSPHGFRSFYVTLRRSEGAFDTQIASEIGDSTVSVLAQSYGDVPPNWVGQTKLSFLPSEGLPAWERWRSEERKIVKL